MQSQEMTSVARDVARRWWWVVVIAVVAALAAAGLAGGRPKASYQAQATFFADTTLLSKYKGIPIPDDVVRDVATPATKRAIAASTGLPASVVSHVAMSGFGNPQNRLLVTATAPSQADALAIVKAADQAVLDYVGKRTTIERTNYEAQVAGADASIAQMKAAEAAPGLDAWQRSDIEFKLWQVGQQRLASQDVVDVLSNVYQLQTPPIVSVVSSSSALASRLAAGGLAGLFVGLVLAGVFEALRRRPGAPTS